MASQPSLALSKNGGVVVDADNEEGSVNDDGDSAARMKGLVGKPLDLPPPPPPPHKGDPIDVAAQTTEELRGGDAGVDVPQVECADGGGDRRERQEREGKELVLLRNVAEKLQREVEGLKSDIEVSEDLVIFVFREPINTSLLLYYS